MAHPGGRPTIYNSQLLEKTKRFIEEYEPWNDIPVEKQDKNGNVTTTMSRQANSPLIIRRLAKHLGIARDTIYGWIEDGKHKEFSDCIKNAEQKFMQEFLIENGLTGGYNPAFAIFTAKNRLGWTDKQEVNQNVTMNIPQEITIKVVRP